MCNIQLPEMIFLKKENTLTHKLKILDLVIASFKESIERESPKPAMRQEAATTGSWTTNILNFPITAIFFSSSSSRGFPLTQKSLKMLPAVQQLRV